MNYYWHDVPGRLRLKTPIIKGNEEEAQRIQALMKPLKGIQSTKVNSVTGSLVVLYDRHATDPETITLTLSRAGYFDRAKAVTNDEYIFTKASSFLNLVALFV
jgi:hypothetical protein